MEAEGLPSKEAVMGGKYRKEPLAHYPNWAFHCPDCGYYELPQNLPEIKEAYEAQTLFFLRPCGCKEGKVSPYTLRLKDVF
tara:strand:- start:368 stop:610 length:243 start_codon:yes stop_codon:yes gene_type:complete